MPEWLDDPRGFLRRLFKEAVASAQPSVVVPAWVRSCIGDYAGKSAGKVPALPAIPIDAKAGQILSDTDLGRPVTVFGAGKASAAMAQSFEQAWPGPVRGFVVTRYGHAVPCRQIEIIEAAHPVPDANSEQAALRILDMAQSLGPDDLAICLISGGGSSLMALPAEGLTLEDKQNATKQLLKSGATISEINTVRKHLSRIKGGRLAEACHPASLIALMISDVPGDDPATIASGPTVPDPTSLEDAVCIIEKYGIEQAKRLRQAMRETPKPGNPLFERTEAQVIASPMMALQAAAAYATSQGLAASILSDRLEGEAAHVGLSHSQIALEAAPAGQPLLILSGGETTVQVKGDGRGGRNVEFLASLVGGLKGHPRIYALAADTDGIDGIEQIAGAIADPTTLQRANDMGLDIGEHQADNDCHTFFENLGDSIVTGPTHTNVNDFRAILILPS